MSEKYVPRHAAPEEPDERKKGLPWPLWIAVGLLVALFLRTFVIGAYYVPSESMLNTIHEGDFLLGEMVSLHFEDPRVGDVVTFDSPLAEGETLVKRVIAVGGQTVDLVDGVVYVDGEPLAEPYTEGKPSESLSDRPGSAGISYPYVVPEGMIWVMGDNRTNSKDSRFFGPVSAEDVTSRVLFIYWPLSHVGAL